MEPGRATRLTVTAAKRSDIALLVVDKGLYILNSENKLSGDDVFQDLLNYDKSCGYTSADSKGVFDVSQYIKWKLLKRIEFLVVQAVGLTSISHTNLHATIRQSMYCIKSIVI